MRNYPYLQGNPVIAIPVAAVQEISNAMLQSLQDMIRTDCLFVQTFSHYFWLLLVLAYIMVGSFAYEYGKWEIKNRLVLQA